MTEKQIWVYADLRSEQIFNYSLNVLGLAKNLSRQMDAKAIMVLAKIKTDDCLEPETAAQKCINSGADHVYILEHPGLDGPCPDKYAKILDAAIRDKKPELTLFALTEFGRELAARIARAQDAGLISDCVDIQLIDGAIVGSCPSWGGRIIAKNTFTRGYESGFATVAPHAFSPCKTPGKRAIVEKINMGSVELPQNIKFLSCEPEKPGKKKLEQARTVVVGGAGMGTAEGFGLVRGLSAALGGQVGATRPPVLSHWVDENRLIGQTGKTIRPRLLVSVATSGALQYTAGITESDAIVAINRDKNAPIFEIADIGIVADAQTFLPIFTAKVKQSLMRRLADDMSTKTKTSDRPSFGKTVKKLRQAHGWSVEALAQKTGQSPEFIEQVESDKSAPSVSFMLRLSRALGVDPGTFLHEEEKTVIRDQRTKAYVKRTQNYSYQVLTPDAENEHLRAFMISIESRQAHNPVAYKHDGEEFIYVLEGALELSLANKPQVLKPGESIRFNSEIPHKLKSKSDITTRCLVVLYTP